VPDGLEGTQHLPHRAGQETLQLGTSNSNPQWFEDVPEVERYDVAFELATGRVAGTVVGPDGRPLAGVEVRLGREGGEAFTMLSFNSRVTTDSNGRFSFVNVDPGDYSVRAGGSSAFGGGGSYGTAIVTGIRLAAGDRREDLRIRLEAAGEIRGRIVDASGRPAASAAVFVRDEAGRLVDSFTGTQSDAGGRFTYRGIAPGTYTVSARGESQACADGSRITVRSGEPTEVELALEPATMVVVTIESATGVASRARVRVLDEEGREYAAMTTPAAMEAAFTQGFSTREHRIGPVPPGSYTVIATTFDGVEKKKPISLRGQEERRVRLDLE
jgi:protocatechuate 3,4-dioxygenase beta subunit